VDGNASYEGSVQEFRPNVALLLCNNSGEMLICERADFPGSWQFPQGGVKKKESLKEALYRETFEEIGIPRSFLEILGSYGPYRYVFPPGLTRGGYSGQEQTVFHARLLDGAPDFDLTHDPVEFRAARWVRPADFQLSWLPEMKQDLYQKVLGEAFGIQIH